MKEGRCTRLRQPGPAFHGYYVDMEPEDAELSDSWLDYFRLAVGTMPSIRHILHQLAGVIGDMPHRSGQGRESV